MPFLTQGNTNWKFIFIVVVFAVIVGGGILFWIENQKIPPVEAPEIVVSEPTVDVEVITAQEVILSDEDVLIILKEFAEKDWLHIPAFAELLPPTGEILLTTLRFENDDVKIKLEEAERKLDEIKMALADSPQARAFGEAFTQFCIAESIVYDDLENTVQRCGYEPTFSFTIKNVSDLTWSRVLPFFINGFVYYYKGDYQEADYYFNQIKLHRAFLEVQFGDDLDTLEYLELYNKVYNKIMEIYPE